MKKHARPKLFISNCLEFEACRYDGGIIHNEFVKRLIKYVEVVRTCPEMRIGLGSPRDAMRQVKRPDDDLRLLSTLKGEDMTNQMKSFTRDYIEELKQTELDGFILKAKSPTCGVNQIKIYKDFGKAPVLTTRGRGFFGGAIADVFGDLPVETEMRLTNYDIRNRFYTATFTLARFREIKATQAMKDLVEFHAHNKYLFMSHHQDILKQMGQIVANAKHLITEEVFRMYHQKLKEILTKEPTQKRRINVLTHIYGYFKNLVSVKEKEFYFEVLNDYLNNQIPYSNVLSVLESWVIRFQDKYLINQTIFRPYPKELTVMMDSGKTI